MVPCALFVMLLCPGYGWVLSDIVLRVVWCDEVRWGANVLWFIVLRCGMLWYCVVWYGIVFCNMVRCGVVWCGLLHVVSTYW